MTKMLIFLRDLACLSIACILEDRNYPEIDKPSETLLKVGF